MCLSFTLLFSSHFYLYSDLNSFFHVDNDKAIIPCASANRGVLPSGRIHSSHKTGELTSVRQLSKRATSRCDSELEDTESSRYSAGAGNTAVDSRGPKIFSRWSAAEPPVVSADKRVPANIRNVHRISSLECYFRATGLSSSTLSHLPQKAREPQEKRPIHGYDGQFFFLVLLVTSAIFWNQESNNLVVCPLPDNSWILYASPGIDYRSFLQALLGLDIHRPFTIESSLIWPSEWSVSCLISSFLVGVSLFCLTSSVSLSSQKGCAGTTGTRVLVCASPGDPCRVSFSSH